MAGPDGYVIRAWSPRGEGTAPFAAPFAPDELSCLKESLARSAGSGRNLRPTGSVGETGWSLAEVGERLFEALFQGEVLSLYERSLDLLGGDPEAGLRIELSLDPREPDLAAFQEIPWELMRQPGTPEALALSRRRPLVRSLAVPRPVYAPRQVSTLRILAVASSPSDGSLAPLGLTRELQNLEKAVGSRLEIVRPEAPTLAALREACFAKECQVLHFMGHGGLLPGSAEGVLYFETEEGGADPVSGVGLVNKVADFPTLRLVVLNACDSAAAADGPLDPLASVAGSLVLGGMPAVVAMQLPVSDEAAIAFSRAFYQRLAAGDPVEAAVAEGRQAIHSADPGGTEWATPVLFLRGRDVAMEGSARGRLARRIAAVVLGLALVAGMGLAGRAWWKARLVTEGAAFFEHGDWGDARERFQTALALDPGSAEILSNLAATEERLGDVRAAEDHYREAVRQRPDSAEHLFNLGLFLNSRGRSDEAYPFLLQAIARDPERVDAYGELVHASLDLGMPERARVALAVALRLDPERPALHRLFGDLELQSGHPREAVAHLTEARRFPMEDRDKAQTAWLLAQARERLGDVASACREIREIRRIDEKGITPWAPEAEALAAKLDCSPL